MLPTLSKLRKAELEQLAKDYGWKLPDNNMTVEQLKEFLVNKDREMETGMRKMTFGQYQDTHTFEEVAEEDSDYCRWCMTTTKPSKRMAEFKVYLNTRKSGSMDSEPSSAHKTEPAKNKQQAKNHRKREATDDEEWVSMDMSNTSPTTTPAPSHTECAASMNDMLNRLLNQIDQHPRATRAMNQMTQMVREQWMEINQTTLNQIQAKAWMEKDPELMKLAARMKRRG